LSLELLRVGCRLSVVGSLLEVQSYRERKLFHLENRKRNTNRQPTTDLLIRQFAAVSEQLLHFLFAESLLISFHLAFAFQHDLHRLGVRHFLELSRAEITNLQLFSFGRISAPVIPVANRAF